MMSNAELAATVARLALMSPLEYDRAREAEARALGVRASTLDQEVAQARRGAFPATRDSDARAPQYSDEALALEFADRHASALRYVAMWGRWLHWTGTRWQIDEKHATFTGVRDLCREQAQAANDQTVAMCIASKKTVAAVECLARYDARLAASADQWDADPWLLNTPAGEIDLRTGEKRPNRPESCCTKQTAVAAEGDCPRWREFLRRITDGNLELQLYLQRAAGYALTGNISEHALFFAYGTGGNGKGVFLNTLSEILAGYAKIAPMETFTASSNDRHSTELAMLRGARLVVSQETESGRRWAESRIKSLTGGDPITARFMRQDNFTFAPQFKLFIAGNHKPGLRAVDEAMRRRLNLIPFTVTIPAGERDPMLPERLKEEWPGILQWAVDGCAEWREKGLAPPAIITSATDEYFEAEDATGQWLGECCIQDRQLQTGTTPLFQSWKAWAEARGEYVGSAKAFSQSLQSKGFERVWMPGKLAGLRGLGLNAVAESSRYQ